MKKGRPGFQLQVICPPGYKKGLSEILFAETTTIGLRYRSENRITLPREIVSVNTPWGKLKAKQVQTPSGSELYPEYEECVKVAKENDIPLKKVYQAILKENNQ